MTYSWGRVITCKRSKFLIFPCYIHRVGIPVMRCRVIRAHFASLNKFTFSTIYRTTITNERHHALRLVAPLFSLFFCCSEKWIYEIYRKYLNKYALTGWKPKFIQSFNHRQLPMTCCHCLLQTEDECLPIAKSRRIDRTAILAVP